MTRAAAQALVSRGTAYLHRDADAAFAQAWDDAIAASVRARLDAAVEELTDRVLRGVPEPVVYQGKPMFTAVDRQGGWVPADDPRAVRDGQGRVVRVPMIIYKKEFGPLQSLLRHLDPSFRNPPPAPAADHAPTPPTRILIAYPPPPPGHAPPPGAGPIGSSTGGAEEEDD